MLCIEIHFYHMGDNIRKCTQILQLMCNNDIYTNVSTFCKKGIVHVKLHAWNILANSAHTPVLGLHAVETIGLNEVDSLAVDADLSDY